MNTPILVSASTYGKVNDEFNFENCLEAKVKGKSEMSKVYKLKYE